MVTTEVWDEQAQSPVAAVEKMLTQADDLPTLPTTVLEVMRVIDDAHCSSNRLGQIVLCDPPLAARVLRLANSAYYGFPRAISAVPQAVTLLGFAALRNVALSVAIFDQFRVSKNAPFDLNALWKHSVGVAATAKIIARRIHFTPLEKAFTAGLLHDIGKILIARYLPEMAQQVQELQEQDQLSLCEAEHQVLGLGHAAFGAWLAARWSFPVSLVDGIAFHHRPEQAGDQILLASLLQLADTLAHRARLGQGISHSPEENTCAWEICPGVLETLGLSCEDVAEIESALDQRRDDISSFASALGVH